MSWAGIEICMIIYNELLFNKITHNRTYSSLATDKVTVFVRPLAFPDYRTIICWRPERSSLRTSWKNENAFYLIIFGRYLSLPFFINATRRYYYLCNNCTAILISFNISNPDFNDHLRCGIQIQSVTESKMALSTNIFIISASNIRMGSGWHTVKADALVK